MEKFVENTSLKQMSMRDQEDASETYLYKLSKKTGLHWFKHIYLFSSTQDNYTHFDSARIQIFKDTEVGSLEKTHQEIVENIFSKVNSPVTRVDVNFLMEG